MEVPELLGGLIDIQDVASRGRVAADPEDDVDLYAGLCPDGDIDRRLQQERLAELETRCEQQGSELGALRSQLDTANKEIERLRCERLVLLTNMSTLFKTARHEIKWRAAELQTAMKELFELKSAARRGGGSNGNQTGQKGVGGSGRNSSGRGSGHTNRYQQQQQQQALLPPSGPVVGARDVLKVQHSHAGSERSAGQAGPTRVSEAVAPGTQQQRQFDRQQQQQYSQPQKEERYQEQRHCSSSGHECGGGGGGGGNSRGRDTSLHDRSNFDQRRSDRSPPRSSDWDRKRGWEGSREHRSYGSSAGVGGRKRSRSPCDARERSSPRKR